MNPEDDLVLAISTDNRMVHVGPADAMLRHLGVVSQHPPASIAAPAGRTQPGKLRLEYFDVLGRQLGAPAHGQHFGEEPESWIRPGDSQQRLLTRISEGLDHLQKELDEHPELGNQGPGLPVITEVPRPKGTYPEVLSQLAEWFFPIDPRIASNRGNWFHNLWHAATGT